MKIGRNDLCPCGSGKKYKKCCINKRPITQYAGNTTPIEASPTEFPFLAPVADKLQPILQEYRVEDIIAAVFSIAAYRRNRSALSQILALHLALSRCRTFGEKRISDYSDMEELFDSISPVLQIDSRNDLTIDDFGEVYLDYCGEHYPIITGTGHTQVYAAMLFMLTLADELQRQNELRTVLRYQRHILETLSSVNFPSDLNEVVFELPPEDLWRAVKMLLSSELYQKLTRDLIPIVGYQKSPIEMRNFIEYQGKYFPLCNLSLLVNYYKYLLSLATKE